MTNHQRLNAQSNTHAGNDFEKIAQKYLEQHLGIILKRPLSLAIGISEIKKNHRFDLGNKTLVIECKSHRWTKGNNVPSAKLTVWNEAMYYFQIAPKSFRKIFFISKSFSEKKQKTLAEYYFEKFNHLIPEDVEIWEYDEENKSHNVIKG